MRAGAREDAEPDRAPQPSLRDMLLRSGPTSALAESSRRPAYPAQKSAAAIQILQVLVVELDCGLAGQLSDQGHDQCAVVRDQLWLRFADHDIARCHFPPVAVRQPWW